MDLLLKAQSDSSVHCRPKNIRRGGSNIYARSTRFSRHLLLLEEANVPISIQHREFLLFGLSGVQNVSLGNGICAQSIHDEHFSSDTLKNKINR